MPSDRDATGPPVLQAARREDPEAGGAMLAQHDARDIAPARPDTRREHLVDEPAMHRARQDARPSTPAVAPSVQRRSHGRTWVAAGAVAACAVAITTASIMPGLGTGMLSTALAVTRPDDSTVVIKILDAAEDPAALTRRLKAEHLSIRVEAVPASPQLVGRWLSAGADADVPGTLADFVAEQTVDKAVDLIVPAHFAGTLSLTIGRPTRPGEHPEVIGTPNALAPGGLLACQDLTGARPAAALKALRDAGWQVVWATGGARRPQASPEPGQRVVQAYV